MARNGLAYGFEFWELVGEGKRGEDDVGEVELADMVGWLVYGSLQGPSNAQGVDRIKDTVGFATR
jgi:hypothetical protein